MEQPAWDKYLLPELHRIASTGYPVPPKDITLAVTLEGMLPSYLKALGRTEAIKELLSYIESRKEAASRINKKNAIKNAYAI